MMKKLPVYDYRKGQGKLANVSDIHNVPKYVAKDIVNNKLAMKLPETPSFGYTFQGKTLHAGVMIHHNDKTKIIYH